MKPFTWPFCLVLSFALSAQVLAAGPGTTNANFLKAGQGVRPIAMGETYIALGDGLDTLSWNPAGLVQLDSPTASFVHSFWVQEIGTEYLAYGMPLGPAGAIGGGITIMHAGAITETLEDQFGEYAGTGGEASAMSIAFVGAYAQELSRILPIKDPFFSKMLVGASLRIVTETVQDASIFGGGVDLGLIWRETEEINGGLDGKSLTRDNGFRFGLVGQNLGVTSDQLMPINFRAGMGYVTQDLFTPNARGTLAVDVLVPIDNDVKISLGGEYAILSPNTEFAARFGYKIGNEIQDLDSLAGLTAGVGVAIRGGAIKYQIDYAFVPYGDLGSTHRAALTLSFLPGENVVLAAPVVPLTRAKPVPKPEPVPAAKPKEEKPAKPEPAPEIPPAAAAVPVVEAISIPATVKADGSAELKRLRKSLRRYTKRVSASMLPPVSFKRNEATYPSKTKKSLDALGKIIEKNKTGNVVITGYAGSNKDLAKQRAEAAARYIKMIYRIEPGRITTKAGAAAEKPKKSSISLEVLKPGQ